MTSPSSSQTYLYQKQQQIETALSKLQIGRYPQELYEPMRYVLSLGGKRIRPVLVLMGCEVFNGDSEKAITPALAIELFHNFTLLHDDIMDNAPLRRNQPTVHVKWNNDIAILSGDAMFAKAQQLITQVDDNVLRSILNLFTKTALEVCEGQQIDMNFETRNDVSIAQYITMITLKTAVLLGCSLQTGALVAGASEEQSKHLYDFGKNLGIAFQLQDDILDVYGDPEKFGKQVGGDIIANKKTWLLLKAIEMSKLNTYKHEELKMWLQVKQGDEQHKVEAITAIYNFLGIKEIATNEMRRFYNNALQSLETLTIENDKKEILVKFAKSLIEREL
jgi:geranylgeranyl diphosphate synthase, type II